MSSSVSCKTRHASAVTSPAAENLGENVEKKTQSINESSFSLVTAIWGDLPNFWTVGWWWVHSNQFCIGESLGHLRMDTMKAAAHPLQIGQNQNLSLVTCPHTIHCPPSQNSSQNSGKSQLFGVFWGYNIYARCLSGPVFPREPSPRVPFSSAICPMHHWDVPQILLDDPRTFLDFTNKQALITSQAS